MCRCYRRVLLVFGSVLAISSSIALGSVFLSVNNALSNSCSFTASNVFTAEVALSKEMKVSKNLLHLQNEQPENEYVETELQSDEPQTIFLRKMVNPKQTNEITIDLEYDERTILEKIVEAEAGSEDITGKMLIANVILNRVNSSRFPDSIAEVVYQKQGDKAQFSPTEDGTFDSVTVSVETKEAVERVLNGEDNSNGALYFRSVRSTGTWHDRALIRLTEYGNHIFYTL